MLRIIISRMTMNGTRPRRSVLLAALCAASLLCLVTAPPARAQDSLSADAVDTADAKVATPAAALSDQLYLPVLSNFSGQPPVCRMGVNVANVPASAFDLAQLHLGWYIDYKAHVTAPHPNGAAYVPVINLSQVGDSGFTSSPSGAELDTAIAQNPGASWIIGNEPDRRFYQNDMLPKAYANAYHSLYYYIKAKDPSARIFAGAIVQPTPLRLEYLNEVLASYWEMFGEALPADGWAIHNFILNERSCAYYEGNATICWGADIPPGSKATDGLVITIDELQKTADVAFFEAQVIRFRQWMADNGYHNLPLYVSEFGILMPESYGFPPSLVKNYMTKTFDFLINTKDEKLGYAADDNRLVQRLSWYSTIDPSFNGSLFQSTSGAPLSPPFELTSMGEHYRDYAASVPVASGFKLLGFSQEAPVGITAGEGVTLTLKATVGNAGNNQWPAGATVRFYLGDPAKGGTELGSKAVQMSGCGQTATVEFTWLDVPASAAGQTAYARLLGPGVDTTMSLQVVRPQEHVTIPFLRRAWQLAGQ